MKPAKTVLAIACMTLAATVFAGTEDIMSSNNQFGLQSLSTNVNYTETGGSYGVPGGTLDTETGGVGGYALSASTMQDLWLGNDYIAFKYSSNSGQTKYVGALLSGGSYGSVVSTSSAALSDYSVRYGKGFPLNDESDLFMLTPYLELGHHQWDRGVNYGETYSHNYFGAGVLGQYSPVANLVFSAYGLIGSTSGSNISIAGPGGFAGALGNSNLYQTGFAIDFAFAQNFHGNVGIDYTSFAYGASGLYSGYFEPDSSTQYTTIKFGLGYAY